MRQGTNSIGLGGDGDEVEFVLNVEAAFGVTFERTELETCRTFGDLYDALCRHLRPVERSDASCLAAAAYWRLKWAIAADHPRRKVTPRTLLRDLRGHRSVAAWWERLGEKSGLRLPRLVLSQWAFIWAAVSLAAPFLTYMAIGDSVWTRLLLGSPVICFFAARYWLWQVPVQTLGELARVAGAYSAATLTAPDADIRARDVWSALELIARNYAPKHLVIERQTILNG